MATPPYAEPANIASVYGDMAEIFLQLGEVPGKLATQYVDIKKQEKEDKLAEQANTRANIASGITVKQEAREAELHPLNVKTKKTNQSILDAQLESVQAAAKTANESEENRKLFAERATDLMTSLYPKQMSEKEKLKVKNMTAQQTATLIKNATYAKQAEMTAVIQMGPNQSPEDMKAFAESNPFSVEVLASQEPESFQTDLNKNLTEKQNKWFQKFVLPKANEYLKANGKRIGKAGADAVSPEDAYREFTGIELKTADGNPIQVEDSGWYYKKVKQHFDDSLASGGTIAAMAASQVRTEDKKADRHEKFRQDAENNYQSSIANVDAQLKNFKVGPAAVQALEAAKHSRLTKATDEQLDNVGYDGVRQQNEMSVEEQKKFVANFLATNSNSTYTKPDNFKAFLNKNPDIKEMESDPKEWYKLVDPGTITENKPSWWREVLGIAPKKEEKAPDTNNINPRAPGKQPAIAPKPKINIPAPGSGKPTGAIQNPVKKGAFKTLGQGQTSSLGIEEEEQQPEFGNFRRV
jgi:hypothetical protein